MDRPLVSVIIPNYCHARYLEERLESVLNQTYQNFEIIIIDDCSPDNGASKAIIEKYRYNEHVAHVIYNEKNSGNTFNQWDRGIGLAKGDLIWIAESDDSCDNRFLETMILEFQKYEDCVLAYSTLIEIDSHGRKCGDIRSFGNQHFSGLYYLKHYLSLANFVRNASGAVFKRRAALNVDKRYMKYKGAGDYLFWVDLVKQGSVSIVNKQLNYFRRHEGVVTTSRDADGSNYCAEKEIYDHIKSIIKISRLRDRLASVYRINRFRHTKFINDEIRRKVYDVWNVEDQISLIDKILLSVFYRIYNRYNYYI